MVFDIYNNNKYTTDKVLLTFYIILEVVLIGSMFGGTYGGGNKPTLFEEYNMPLFAYVITTFIAIVILLLAFNKMLSLGVTKRLTIDSENFIITSSILQRQKIVNWSCIKSIAPDYKVWKTDVPGQVWSASFDLQNQTEELSFIVNDNEEKALRKLINQYLTVPNIL